MAHVWQTLISHLEVEDTSVCVWLDLKVISVKWILMTVNLTSVVLADVWME